MFQLFLLYFSAINALTFAAYALDKYKARHRQWRISEAALLTLSFLGGWIGAILGMFLCRHKIRKWKFRLGVPLSGLIWVCLLLFLL